MERSTITYLVTYGDERFPPVEDGPMVATPTADMLACAKDIAQASAHTLIIVVGVLHGTCCLMCCGGLI